LFLNHNTQFINNLMSLQNIWLFSSIAHKYQFLYNFWSSIHARFQLLNIHSTFNRGCFSLMSYHQCTFYSVCDKIPYVCFWTTYSILKMQQYKEKYSRPPIVICHWSATSPSGAHVDNLFCFKQFGKLSNECVITAF
jgi:hypothetical protein